MARQRKLTPERKAFINSLLEHYQPSDANDVQEMLKDLLGDTLQGMLEAEMDQKLGYALIILAADLLNEWFGFEIDCKALTKFLVDNETNSGNDRDSYDGVYDKLVACIRGNYNHFSRNYTSKGKLEQYKAVEEWGFSEYLHDAVKVDGTDSRILALIALPYFDKIVSKELGYEDPKAIKDSDFEQTDLIWDKIQ